MDILSINDLILLIMSSNNIKISSKDLGKVKKLAYIVTLDDMLKSYDELKQVDDDYTARTGTSVSELTDAIIEKLTNLVNSERTLTCRNVLIANYDTMTAPQYWLGHKLFADLPKDASDALQMKIRQMVDLMAELAMKIFQLGESHSDAFFKKLMKRYKASLHTPYEIWKTRQLKLTMKEYRQYQAELTANILNLGVMDYGDKPRGEERAAVRLDLLTLEMSHDKELSDDIVNAAAKIRRYTYWEGNKFMIDYPLAKLYLYHIFDKLNNDQRIQVYYYNVQMTQIHEDMDKLEGRQHLKKHAKTVREIQENEEIFKYVHPSLDDEAAWQVHNEVKRLVSRQGIQQICRYLKKLDLMERTFLPVMPSVVYAELVRMGMPDGDGFSEKTFMRYYRK